MIKAIRIKKKMKFRELMEYIIQNDVSGVFESSDGKEFTVDNYGKFHFDVYLYGRGETYEVEVEEEIEWDKRYNQLILIRGNNTSVIAHDCTIEWCSTEASNITKIYVLAAGELVKVWER